MFTYAKMCWDLANDLAPLHGTSKIEVVSPSTSLTSSTRLTRGITATSTARSFGCSGHVPLQLTPVATCDSEVTGHGFLKHTLRYSEVLVTQTMWRTWSQGFLGWFLLIPPADWFDCHYVSDSTEAAQMDGAILVVSGQCDRPSEVHPDRPSQSPPEVARLWWSYATDTGAHPVVPAGWCVPALRGFQLDAKKTTSSKLGMLESCIWERWRLWWSWLCFLNFGSIGQASFVMRVALSSFCSTDLSSVSTIHFQCAFDQAAVALQLAWFLISAKIGVVGLAISQSSSHIIPYYP